MNSPRLAAGLLLMAASAAHGANCFISSLPALNFGNYNPFSASPLDSTTTAGVFCIRTVATETVTMNITLSTGGSGSYFPRKLRDPLNNPLDYNLYGDAGRTVIFGNGTPGTSTYGVAFVLNAGRPFISIPVNIYGRISAGQDPRVGSYSDTVIFTVNY
jgi:spore coat protein U-like protein